MILYHGTSESNLNKILEQGSIQPRGTAGKSNWEHTIISSPDRVYLTTAYAGYFAANVSKENERWAIIEIDTDFLDEDNFFPDEDVIAQIAYRSKDFNEVWGDKPVKEYSLLELTKYVREHIYLWKDKWPDSIQAMGTCSYKGDIPVAAIIRYALFDPKSNFQMAMSAQDPTITTLNYQIKGATYKAITKWLMGEEITFDEYDPITAQQLADPEFPDNHREQFEQYKAQAIETLANQKIETVNFRADNSGE